MTVIDNIIICNPYEKPSHYWRYDISTRKHVRELGRRPAGFLTNSNPKTRDDPSDFEEIELVNIIRERVDSWRDRGYPGITGITRELLAYWNDKDVPRSRFFFCQLEAIETLIWLTEAPNTEKSDIDIPSDGGNFQRLCNKMATGTGKTVVMAMLIAWQVINKMTYVKDTRFTNNVLIVTPGITVRTRLQVLHPSDIGNYYDEFDIVPNSMTSKLRMAKIQITNWHKLKPIKEEKYSVSKIGTESDIALARRILDHNSNNIIVINDEAHHAYRSDSDVNSENTIWIDGLDKIHNARNILRCYDFSATPFISSTKTRSNETLFSWIVSDFSLSDAVESGLTKTPKTIIEDDSSKYDKEHKSRLYHIYKDDEVMNNLNQKTNLEKPLPTLISNAYSLLGNHWKKTHDNWIKKENNIPPVMITVCNHTYTAARVAYSFKHNKFKLAGELSDSDYLLHIDSDILRKAEEGKKLKSDIDAEGLRNKVNTVGKLGKSGEQIRNIIAVQMLSEGWDARNVTHIMGLRAFTSQLLCEQVVGRGLRRASYDIDEETKLLLPEYVYIVGVPFAFLPHESDSTTNPPKPSTIIQPDPEKIKYHISWPNIDRIDSIYSTKLQINWKNMSNLRLTSKGTVVKGKFASVIDGTPHLDKMEDIDMRKLEDSFREQTIIYETANDVFNSMRYGWGGKGAFLFVQLVKLVDDFIKLDKIDVIDVFKDQLRKKMTIWFNMNKVVMHVGDAIEENNAITEHIVLNYDKPIKTTGDMRPFPTTKPVTVATKSHMNMAIIDSGWEKATVDELVRNNKVISWVKNTHHGLIIYYTYNGITRRYIPDFIITLNKDIKLILEVKGKDDTKNRAKRKGLDKWIKCVNDDGKYGIWGWEVAFDTSEVPGIIEEYSSVKCGTIPKVKACKDCKKRFSECQCTKIPSGNTS